MPSIFKSALPLTLTVAPLLLAAAEPPLFDPDGACGLEDISRLTTGVQDLPLLDFRAVPVVQPVNTPTRVLVTSEQEMASFLSDRQPPAPQIRLGHADEGDPVSGDRSTTAQPPCRAEQIAPQLAYPVSATLSKADIAQMTDEDGAETAPAITPVPPELSTPNIDVGPALATLPDGNYRYVSGETEGSGYTDQALRQRGGSLFLLKKEGDTVTGDLLPRLGLPGICITGSVNGDTISGAAYPDDTTDTLQDSARNIGETFEPYGSGALQIRRTRTEGNRLYYASAILDLSNFSRINAGSSLPPTRCGAGRTGFRDQR